LSEKSFYSDSSFLFSTDTFSITLNDKSLHNKTRHNKAYLLKTLHSHSLISRVSLTQASFIPLSLFLFLVSLASMETKKPTKSLNPYAPAFTPPSRSPPLFNFNKPFPCYNKPFKAITGAHVKPEKNPFVRYGFCHRRCLPPRLLKKPLPENKLAGRTSVMVKNIPNCLGSDFISSQLFYNFVFGDG